MSSLQKFHRRTQSSTSTVPVYVPLSGVAIGSAYGGGWYLGGLIDGGISRHIIVSPASDTADLAWGSYGTLRGTTSKTNGLANTITLFSFGTTAHPGPGHCRTRTTGGYSDWYAPAINEILVIYSNHAATPFATSNAMVDNVLWSSTESSAGTALWMNPVTGDGSLIGGNTSAKTQINHDRWRPIRRTTG